MLSHGLSLANIHLLMPNRVLVRFTVKSLVTWTKSAIISGLLSVTASNALADDPFRHLDGEKLAHRLTPPLLQRFSRADLRSDPYVPTLADKLYMGQEFESMNRAEVLALQNWLASRPDHSVLPHELIEKATELSRGSVFYGLVLCWDVLRVGWGNAVSRNAYPLILKLYDITGELDKFDGNFFSQEEWAKRKKSLITLRKKVTVRGDNFSAWYHFIGTALHSFTMTNSRWQTIPGWWQTRLLIWLEEIIYGNLFGSFLDGKKRIRFDIEGENFGRQLAQNLSRYHNALDYIADHGPAPPSYLTSRPEIYGFNWKLKAGQSPKNFGTDQTSSPTRSPLLARYHLYKDPTSAALAAQVETFMQEDVPELIESAAETLRQKGFDEIVPELTRKKLTDRALKNLIQLFSEGSEIISEVRYNDLVKLVRACPGAQEKTQLLAELLRYAPNFGDREAHIVKEVMEANPSLSTLAIFSRLPPERSPFYQKTIFPHEALSLALKLLHSGGKSIPDYENFNAVLSGFLRVADRSEKTIELLKQVTALKPTFAERHRTGILSLGLAFAAVAVAKWAQGDIAAVSSFLFGFSSFANLIPGERRKAPLAWKRFFAETASEFLGEPSQLTIHCSGLFE